MVIYSHSTMEMLGMKLNTSMSLHSFYFMRDLSALRTVVTVITITLPRFLASVSFYNVGQAQLQFLKEAQGEDRML